MRMVQGVRTGLGHGASPVSYRHNFLVLSNWDKKKKIYCLRFLSGIIEFSP